MQTRDNYHVVAIDFSPTTKLIQTDMLTMSKGTAEREVAQLCAACVCGVAVIIGAAMLIVNIYRY
jgi:hypothetical protein